jgi:hypothetical protein
MEAWLRMNQLGRRITNCGDRAAPFARHIVCPINLDAGEAFTTITCRRRIRLIEKEAHHGDY